MSETNIGFGKWIGIVCVILFITLAIIGLWLG